MQVGRDAVICALMAGRPEVLRVLLERGASTVEVNYVGQRVAVALTKPYSSSMKRTGPAWPTHCASGIAAVVLLRKGNSNKFSTGSG